MIGPLGLIEFSSRPSVSDIIMMAGVCILAGFAIVAIGGLILLPILRRFQFAQHAYEDAPETHQSKTGTPTMGGILFGLALLPMITSFGVPFENSLLYTILACGLIGLIDDFIGVRFGRNRGLRARTKLLMTALVAILFLRAIDGSYSFFPRDVLLHVGGYSLIAPHWLWILLGIIAITGCMHAVNLTDGLDGLAAGTMLAPLAVIAWLGFRFVLPAVSEAALLGFGACLGFLLYNRHPAKIFMGDTGSLLLGGLFACTAIVAGEMLLLIIIGGVFVAEALSVMLQVSYFKLSGGKRIFRMSPLHHHFEVGGMSEVAVTSRFWIASILLSILGYSLVRWG